MDEFAIITYRGKKAKVAPGQMIEDIHSQFSKEFKLPDEYGIIVYVNMDTDPTDPRIQRSTFVISFAFEGKPNYMVQSRDFIKFYMLGDTKEADYQEAKDSLPL